MLNQIWELLKKIFSLVLEDKSSIFYSLVGLGLGGFFVTLLVKSPAWWMYSLGAVIGLLLVWVFGLFIFQSINRLENKGLTFKKTKPIIRSRRIQNLDRSLLRREERLGSNLSDTEEMIALGAEELAQLDD